MKYPKKRLMLHDPQPQLLPAPLLALRRSTRAGLGQSDVLHARSVTLFQASQVWGRVFWPPKHLDFIYSDPQVDRGTVSITFLVGIYLSIFGESKMEVGNGWT